MELTVSIPVLIGVGVFVMLWPLLLQIEKKTYSLGSRLFLSTVTAFILGLVGHCIPDAMIADIQRDAELRVMSETLLEPWDILYRECIKNDDRQYQEALVGAWNDKYPEVPKITQVHVDLFWRDCRISTLPKNFAWGFSLEPNIGDPE